MENVSQILFFNNNSKIFNYISTIIPIVVFLIKLIYHTDLEINYWIKQKINYNQMLRFILISVSFVLIYSLRLCIYYQVFPLHLIVSVIFGAYIRIVFLISAKWMAVLHRRFPSLYRPSSNDLSYPTLQALF